MRKLISVILLVFFSNGFLTGQTYPNFLNHTIDRPPKFFLADSPNADLELDGIEYKVRTYRVQLVDTFTCLTCIYVKRNLEWHCIMGRFFSWYLGQNRNNGVYSGIFNARTGIRAVQMINFHNQQGIESEWQNFDGVFVSGDPKWAAAILIDNDYVIATELNSKYEKKPLNAIIAALDLFRQLLDKKPSNSDQETPRNKNTPADQRKSDSMPSVNSIY